MNRRTHNPAGHCVDFQYHRGANGLSGGMAPDALDEDVEPARAPAREHFHDQPGYHGPQPARAGQRVILPR